MKIASLPIRFSTNFEFDVKWRETFITTVGLLTLYIILNREAYSEAFLVMTCIIVRQQTVKVNKEGEMGRKLVVATGGTSIKSIMCVLKYLIVKINIEVM